MKTPEQFVNEECAVYNAETLVKAVAARDREVAEACALVAEFSRPHWKAARHLEDTDDAEAHEAVAMALEDAAKNLRARFSTQAAGPAPEPVKPPATCETCKGSGKHSDSVDGHRYERWCSNCRSTGRTPTAGTAPTPSCCDLFRVCGRHQDGCPDERGTRP